MLQPTRTFNDVTAAQLVGAMTIGWNLGNTLDAHPGGEASWGNPITTQANINTIYDAGFNTIRIPVTWYQQVNSNFEISKSWMNRVTEVVNYAVNKNMYIILNTHHDEEIFKFTKNQRDKSLRAFWRIWSQIAYNFQNYDERLIFEGLNEPRTKGSAAEWSGGTAEERDIVNEYYNLFIRTVRTSGGNNNKRVLMLNTYAASAESVALTALTIPNDPDNAVNKIIVSIHMYSPFDFALNQGSGAVSTFSASNPSDTSHLRSRIDQAYNLFVSKGIPVVIGEFGAVDRNNLAARVAWAEYYVGYARNKDIPCVLWDNGNFTNGERFGFLDRHTNTFQFPTMLAALMRGAGVN